MARPIHFEIHASDPDRVQDFYRKLFGWQFQKWEGPMEYWLVTTGPDAEPGINGGLLRRQGPPAAEGQGVNAYVCTVGVDSGVMRISGCCCLTTCKSAAGTHGPPAQTNASTVRPRGALRRLGAQAHPACRLHLRVRQRPAWCLGDTGRAPTSPVRPQV
jgi:predicted enzyme related to lactoylglutathione lyase